MTPRGRKMFGPETTDFAFRFDPVFGATPCSTELGERPGFDRVDYRKWAKNRVDDAGNPAAFNVRKKAGDSCDLGDLGENGGTL